MALATAGRGAPASLVPRTWSRGGGTGPAVLLAERIGKAETADVGVSFEEVEGRDVCRVDVAPADKPAFVGSTGGARTADFHLRVGNATRRLLTDEVLDYRAKRWT